MLEAYKIENAPPPVAVAQPDFMVFGNGAESIAAEPLAFGLLPHSPFPEHAANSHGYTVPWPVNDSVPGTVKFSWWRTGGDTDDNEIVFHVKKGDGSYDADEWTIPIPATGAGGDLSVAYHNTIDPGDRVTIFVRSIHGHASTIGCKLYVSGTFSIRAHP